MHLQGTVVNFQIVDVLFYFIIIIIIINVNVNVIVFIIFTARC